MIEKYSSVVPACTENFTCHWKGGEERDLFTEMLQMTLTIIARILFNQDLDKNSGALEKAATTLVEYFSRLLSPSESWRTKLPTTRNRKFKKSLGYMEQVIRGVIVRVI